jgi:hypothetical protein
MSREWIIRLIQMAAITITIAAVCQELEKPKEERHWHGKLGFIPYDFRLPTVERFKESYWNPDDSRIFTPEVLGIGWAINLYALLEKLRIIGESYASEEDFLMPTQSLRRVLEHRPVME